VVNGIAQHKMNRHTSRICRDSKPVHKETKGRKLDAEIGKRNFKAKEDGNLGISIAPLARHLPFTC
jgi:hypothetical protein